MAGIVQSAGILADYARTRGRLSTTFVSFFVAKWFKKWAEPGNTKRGKYHRTVDLLFDWFGISCMTTDNFCFYLQNRLIQI